MSDSLNQVCGFKNWFFSRLLLFIVLTFILTSVLFFPFTQNVMLTFEIATYFTTLIALSVIGCSIEYRHRSLFMFHYHGTRTVVLNELTQEMSET